MRLSYNKQDFPLPRKPESAPWNAKIKELLSQKQTNHEAIAKLFEQVRIRLIK